MRNFLVLSLLFCFLTSILSAAQDTQTQAPKADTSAPEPNTKASGRVEAAGTVLDEIQAAPDKGIPEEVLASAECVSVVPSLLNGGFVFGGRYGRGVASCRTEKGWSAPAFFTIGGGSFGLQIGGQATDFVLLIMNGRGANSVLSSKVKLGADASAAAGPKGRNAEASTDVTLRAEILSYSRARGLFAGISLAGSTVRPDNSANQKLYKKNIAGKDIVFKGVVPVPASAQRFISYLNKKSPKNRASGKEI